MTFARRLRIYLLGVGLGLLVVYIFFKDRDLSGWTPQGRVLTAIDSSAVTLSERALCQLQCLEVEAANWRSIYREAKVNFNESNTKKKPCPIYHIKSYWKGEKYTFIWEVCENEEQVALLAVSSESKSCACEK